MVARSYDCIFRFHAKNATGSPVNAENTAQWARVPGLSIRWLGVTTLCGVLKNSHEMEAVSLTLVEYPAGDLVGKMLAHACLLPVFLVVAVAAAAFARRELILVGCSRLFRGPRLPTHDPRLPGCLAGGDGRQRSCQSSAETYYPGTAPTPR